MIELIYDFWGNFYEPMFIRRAALALFLLTPISAAAGVMVVNQRMAFFADAVGHSVFAGVALALLLAWPERPVVLGVSIFIGLSVVYLSRHSRLASDTVIGLVFSAAIAFGLAIVSRNPASSKGLSRFLLGDILTINNQDILALAILACISIVFMLFFYNHLSLEAFSPILARNRNPLKNKFAPYVFAVFLAVLVTILLWSVGVLLVTALLVAPAAVGRNWAKSASGMFHIAIVVSLISGQCGLYLSTLSSINTSTGATVVLCAISIFILSYFARRRF